MDTAKRLHGSGEYYFSAKLREIEAMNKDGDPVINLGIGNPDLPPHPDVIRALQETATEPGSHGYQSYRGIATLRGAMAEWYHRNYKVTLDPESEILPLMGSKEGIMHICMSYLDEGSVALVPDPGYPAYANAVKLAGGIPVHYQLSEENEWHPDPESLESLADNARLLFLNYPHMPSGQLPIPEKLDALIRFAEKKNMLIVYDNPYSFILNSNPFSLLSRPGAMEWVLELNSLSKSHNMAGWRVGMLCASRRRINEVLLFKSNMDSGMFLPVQKAAIKALQLDEHWHHQMNSQYMIRRNDMARLLSVLGCSVSGTQAGMFLWAGIPSGYENAFEFSDMILNRFRIFLTPGGIFGSSGMMYIRGSLCCNPEIINEAMNRIVDVQIKRA